LSNFQSNVLSNSVAFALQNQMGGILSSGAMSYPTILGDRIQRSSAPTSLPASKPLVAPRPTLPTLEASTQPKLSDEPTSKEDLDLQFQRQYRLRQLQYVPLTISHSWG
jgi:hypothetical protein